MSWWAADNRRPKTIFIHLPTGKQTSARRPRGGSLFRFEPDSVRVHISVIPGTARNGKGSLNIMAESKFPSIKKVSTDSLVPYARNARTHSEAQVAQIAASIKEFGFTNPILTDGANGIIAGHGRLLAALKLGLDEVPVIELEYLTKAQKQAYIIADNKLALNAGWDDGMLAVEFEELQAADFDMALTGFSDAEIAALLNDEGGVGGGSEKPNTLADRFGIPPFSVLNAREGWWQARKSSWLSLGIQSELGRGGGSATPPSSHGN